MVIKITRSRHLLRLFINNIWSLAITHLGIANTIFYYIMVSVISTRSRHFLRGLILGFWPERECLCVWTKFPWLIIVLTWSNIGIWSIEILHSFRSTFNSSGLHPIFRQNITRIILPRSWWEVIPLIFRSASNRVSGYILSEFLPRIILPRPRQLVYGLTVE